jgi:predicted secreted protein
MSFKVIVFLFVLTLSMVSCDVVTYKLNENGVNHITLKVYTELHIVVNGNPSTGYGWYVENARELRNRRTVVPLNLNKDNSSKDFQSNSNPQQMRGVGGQYTFKLLASARGEAVIQLVNKRSWENGGKYYSIQVTIN